MTNKKTARRFNPNGMQLIEERLSKLWQSSHSPELLDEGELFSEEFSSSIGNDVPMTKYNGSSRIELLDLVSKQLGPEHKSNFEDQAMWTWIAVYHSKHLWVKTTNKTSEKSRSEKIIMGLPGSKWHRHLLAGPMCLYERGGAKLVHPKTNEYSEWMNAAFGVSDFYRIDCVLDVFYKLYHRDGSWTFPERDSSASHRRFGNLIAQLQVTFCLQRMTAEQLEVILPDAFKGLLV